jgi:poly-gamma-glutamate synthase PgsB/CapB
VYLAVERIRLGRNLAKIPLRIGITGTRGKSGVTRLVAAGLRTQGRRVLAKTTGSRPVLILPDGTETDIQRAGPASIREQVRLMALASEIGADTVVAEFMSIGEECLATESRGIVRPGILALTNVRLDHLDEMGGTKEDIARTLSAAFPEGGTVFVPREEVHPVFEGRADRLRARIVPVEPSRGSRGGEVAQDAEAERGSGAASFPTLRHEFEPNLRLSREILAFLGVPRDRAWAGMARAVPDFGSLRIWLKRFEHPPRNAYFASAFAANDPESSAAVLEKIGGILSLNAMSIVGLLCLREDRGNRTLQWIRAAEEGFFGGFERVAILGRPGPAALRRLRRRLGSGGEKFVRPAERRLEEAVSRLVSASEREPVVVGLGNIVGTGERIVRHWEETGVPYVY